MSIPSPSGYCGASRRMRQIGVASDATTSSDASRTRSRESFDMVDLLLRFAVHLRLRLLAHVRHELDGRPGRRHADVALHLLVERRAEVGAVERIDARSLRDPG